MKRIAPAIFTISALAAGVLFVMRGASCHTRDLRATFNQVQGDSYPLDDLDRSVPPDGGLPCPKDEVVTYSGTSLSWKPPVEVIPPFRKPLAEFERVTLEVAIEFYGREPAAIRHVGAYACRPVRHRPERLSEHALGNAVDFVGLDFKAATADAGVPDSFPKALDRAFQVRVQRDWLAETGSSKLHAQFLERLVERLRAENTFRVMLGPAHEFHAAGDHWHFDYGPWSLVKI